MLGSHQVVTTVLLSLHTAGVKLGGDLGDIYIYIFFFFRLFIKSFQKQAVIMAI